MEYFFSIVHHIILIFKSSELRDEYMNWWSVSTQIDIEAMPFK